jgi:hydroxybutyrate-dimer hydrolase
VPAAAAGRAAHFRADLTAAELAAYNAAHPHRVAYKHAHSQQNPERDWGRNTLQAIGLAFYVLNEQFARDGTAAGAAAGNKRRAITPANTLVIASSVSNGGGAALAAAEQDVAGLIDGIAVSEPNVQPRRVNGLEIRQGGQAVATIGKPLVDYFTFANLYQPCAILAEDAGLSLAAAFWPEAFTTAARNRCTGLAEKGLVSGSTPEAQAADALARLHAYGWQREHDFLHQSHYRFATGSIAVTYVNALGRFGVADNVCGFSFANTGAGGAVVPQVPPLLAGLFASGNGIPPTSGVNIVYNDAVGGARLDFLAASPSTGRADFALDGALCLRALATGRDPATGGALTDMLKAQAERVQAGLAEVLLEAKPTGKPTLIVSGRNDTLIPPNHASRAYVGQLLRGARGDAVRYVEVLNAQHFDTFIAFGPALGYDSRYVPLHHYFGQAMDAMYAHLKNGTPLPASQLVRTKPRAAGEPLELAHLPAIQATPAAGDRIELRGNVLLIPD